MIGPESVPEFSIMMLLLLPWILRGITGRENTQRLVSAPGRPRLGLSRARQSVIMGLA
jgi:hypothetical protein